MISFQKGLAGLLVTIIMVSNVYAGNGEYDGFKLGKFENLPPKKVVKDFSINFSGYPRKLSLKKFQSAVKSQSDRGACAYFSSAALVESLIKRETKKEVNISEEYLIYHGKAVRGMFSSGDGSKALDNLESMKSGFYLEKDMPYQPNWFNKGLPCDKYKDEAPNTPDFCYSHYGPTDIIKNKKINFDNFKIHYVYDGAHEVIKKMNMYKAPVIVGLPLHPEGWDRKTGVCVYNEEYREKCQDPKAGCGGHSVLLTGYDMDKREFTFKNSWNSSWGVEGYGTLSFEYIDKWGKSGMVTASYTGDLKIPTDYNVISEPSSENVKYSIDQTDGIKVTMSGKFKNVLNRVLYTSTFIASQKDLELPISDDNVNVMEVPESLKDTYGFYVRGADHFLQNGVNEVVIGVTDPAVMEIPREAYLVDPLVDQYYLRISAYIHDDIKGWNKVYRVYKPVEL